MTSPPIPRRIKAGVRPAAFGLPEDERSLPIGFAMWMMRAFSRIRPQAASHSSRADVQSRRVDALRSMAAWAHQRTLLLGARLVLFVAHPLLIAYFFAKLRYVPDPAFPKRYNELFLWRKLIDRNPLFVTLSDKLAAKAFARARCPDLPIVETLWSGTDPAGIPASLLVGDVMVKASHGSGFNLAVTGGAPSRAEIIKAAAGWIRRPYGIRHGEWACQAVPPQILVEDKLRLGGGDLPTDLKLHAFDGAIAHCWAVDRIGGRSLTYDANANPIATRDSYCPRHDQVLPDTAMLRLLVREAVVLAARMSRGLDHVRVDLMIADGRLVFGELTVYPCAGYDMWDNPSISQNLARTWDIRKSWFLTTPRRGLMRLYAEALRAVLDAR